jgi:hypothetical protein
MVKINIFLTQKTFRESGSDTDTDSIIDDAINMEKENPRSYLFYYFQVNFTLPEQRHDVTAMF